MQKKTLDDIRDVVDACIILNKSIPIQYPEESNQQFAGRQLELIIEAANFIDNDYNYWNPDFNNRDLQKWLPYFIKERSGWLVYGVLCYGCCSCCPVVYYYKTKTTAQAFATKFLDLYNQWLG